MEIIAKESYVQQGARKGLFQLIIGALLRNDVHSVERRGGITEIWEGMKHKVWTNNSP